MHLSSYLPPTNNPHGAPPTLRLRGSSPNKCTPDVRYDHHAFRTMPMSAPTSTARPVNIFIKSERKPVSVPLLKPD